MTRVTIRDEKDRAGIDMVGHANHDGQGGDIVCAACSVLIQALANALYVQDVRMKWSQKSGEAHVEFEAGRTLHKDLKARGAFEMCCMGLEMLAQSYPKNVTIEK